MEELEEMDAYNDRPLTGTSTAEDSVAQVTCFLHRRLPSVYRPTSAGFITTPVSSC